METTTLYFAGLILILAMAAVAKLRLPAMLVGLVASFLCFSITMEKTSDAAAIVAFGFIFALFCILTLLELRERA